MGLALNRRPGAGSIATPGRLVARLNGDRGSVSLTKAVVLGSRDATSTLLEPQRRSPEHILRVQPSEQLTGYVFTEAKHLPASHDSRYPSKDIENHPRAIGFLFNIELHIFRFLHC
jgi:hypothetical protein